MNSLFYIVYRNCPLLISIFLFFNQAEAQQPGAGNRWAFADFGSFAAGSLQWNGPVAVMKTRNTRHCYFESDKFSFCWQPQAFPFDECSHATFSVTITQLDRGTAGIMIRSDSSEDAANAHLEVNSAGEVLLFSRAKKGQATSYKRLGKQPLPVTLRLSRNGSTFTGAFKSAGNQGKWLDSNIVFSEVGDLQLTGFYGCSGTEPERPAEAAKSPEMKATFTNWTASYTENFIAPEKDFRYPETVDKDILIEETFDDGNLSNLPERPNNPLWQGIKYALLPHGGVKGRYWQKLGSGFYTLGKDGWGDYELSFKFAAVDKDKSMGNVACWLRYRSSELYPQMDQYFAVVIKQGDLISFEKHRAGNIQILKSVKVHGLGDGRFHKLKVSLVDQSYRINLDGQLLAAGKDTLQPVTMGKVAFQFQQAAVKIDDVLLRSLPDPTNGLLDNLLRDYFDRPVPKYLKKYGISDLLPANE